MSLNLDLTGLDQSNLIVAEKQSVTTAQIGNSGAIFAKNGMFFGNGLSVSVEMANATTLLLTKNVDYWLIGKLIGVGESAGGVYCGIFVADPALAGKFSLTYQALGGNLSINTTNVNQFYATPASRQYAQNNKAVPQPSLGLTIATNKDLQQLQAGRPLIPINVVYASAAVPVKTVGSSLGMPSAGDPNGTSGPVTIASITDAGQVGKAVLAATTPAAAKAALAIAPIDIGAATAAQGARADSALQAVSVGDLVDASSIGAGLLFAGSAERIKNMLDFGFSDIIGLGTAALYDVDLFANAMQGSRADTSIQSINGQLPDTSGDVSGLLSIPTIGPGASPVGNTNDGYNKATLLNNAPSATVIHKNALPHFGFSVIGTVPPVFSGEALTGGGSVAIDDKRDIVVGKTYFECKVHQTGQNTYVVTGSKS
jgi:hypothetical protein